MGKHLLTIEEASTALGVHPDTLRRWEKKGVISPIRTEGGHRRYSLSDVKKTLSGKKKRATFSLREGITRDLQLLAAWLGTSQSALVEVAVNNLIELLEKEADSCVSSLRALAEKWSQKEKEQMLQCAESYIYVVADGEYFKIEFSNNPEFRFGDLQRGNPRTLALVTTFPGGRSLERELHQKYASKCVQGEWFQLDPEDLEELLKRGKKSSVMIQGNSVVQDALRASREVPEDEVFEEENQDD
jgi:excisionase family DNA binding protein